jgi:hypothetical protein
MQGKCEGVRVKCVIKYIEND